MPHLFLKTKTKQCLIVWLLLSVCKIAAASDTIPNQSFIEYCNNSDAFILYQYTDISINKLWSSYERNVSFQYKMVINKKSGVDNYAFLNLSKYVVDHLKKIQVKTLKSDGSIVKLDSSIILNHKHKNEELDLIYYPIPGVEPGDTIEIKYLYTEYLGLYELKDFVSLYNSVPAYNVEYTVKLPPELFIRYKPYNGFPDPQIMVNDEMVYCAFKMENIKGVEQNDYTCLSCELPYIYYSVNTEEDDILEWKDVYNNEFNLITQPLLLDYEKQSYYRRWKNNVIGEADDSSKYYKFELLYQDILDNFSIEPTKEEEFIKSSGYFLKQQRLDPISLRRLYRQLLEDLEIKYWAVFARSKRAGEIDPNYIRKGEYDHIFFAYENSNGTLNLLYPHDIDFKYQIKEIPTSLYNTVAVIVQPYSEGKIKAKDKYINADLEMTEADSVIVQLIKLPGMNANYNSIKQYFNCDVDIVERTNSFSSRFIVSGGLSTDIRSFFSVLGQDKKMNDFYNALAEFEGDNTAYNIDTVTHVELKKTIPFIYDIKGKGSINNSITFLNDSLFSITLDKLIQHTLINSESDSIDLNYYLDYCYSDFCMYMFNFSGNIELLNNDNYNKTFKNDIGEFNFKITVQSSNMLVIQSDYRIITESIEKCGYDHLKKLNNKVKEMKNTRLLIKVK